MQKNGAKLLTLLFHVSDDEREDKAKVFMLLQQEVSDVDGLVALCEEIAGRKWEFGSVWYRIADIVSISLRVMSRPEKERFGESLFFACTQRGKSRSDREDRALVLGFVLGFFLAAEFEEADENFVLSFLSRLVTVPYQEPLLSISKGDTITARYEEPLSKAIREFAKRGGLPLVSQVRRQLHEFLRVMPRRQPNKLTGLVLGRLAHALLEELPPAAKIKAVLGMEVAV